MALIGCTQFDPESDAEHIARIKTAKARQKLAAPLTAVTVTYVRPAGADPINDPAGFTIQAATGGPALFIPLGPDELDPYPRQGDVLRMNVVEILEPGLSLTGALWTPEDGAFVAPTALQSALAHWRLEGNGADEKGSTYTARLQSVRTIHGRIDKYAVAFDGDQSIGLTNTALNFPTEPFTVSFWIKRRGPQSQYTGVLGNLSESGGWGVDFGSERGDSIRLSSRGEGAWGGGAQSIPLQNGVWEHVVFTRQGDYVQGYLNGTKVMSDTARSRFGPAMVKFSFGGFGANPRFRGSLDDIALWTRALSETEIKGLYHGPTTPRSWFPPEDVEQLKAHLATHDPNMRQRMSGVFNGRIALSDLQILGTTRLDPIVHDLSASEDVLEQSARVHDQLVRIQAKIQGAFVAHGQGFVSADLQTETQSSLQRIRLRLPESLVLQKNLGDGCIVRTEPTPLRFYRDTPIISLVTEAELEVLSCPETQAAPLENTPRKANTVVISELMPRPSTGLSTTDQWFELFNTQTEPVNLRGCHIRLGGEDTPILIRESMPIAPRAYLLVKTSEAADTLPKGGVIAPSFNMIGSDQTVDIELLCSGTTIAAARLPLRDEIGKSYAMQDQTVDGKRRWCLSPAPYAQKDGVRIYGTPGRKNDCP